MRASFAGQGNFWTGITLVLVLGLFQNCGKFQSLDSSPSESSGDLSSTFEPSPLPAPATPPTLAISLNDSSEVLNRQARLTLSASRTSSAPVSVTWATEGGTAESGIHFLASQGTVTLAAGETSATISVPLIRSDSTDVKFNVRALTTSEGQLARPLATFNLRGDSAPHLIKNMWKGIATALAPQARVDHTEVFTGKKVLIWGGLLNTGGFTNTGGIYDPRLDSWTATSLTNAPTARINHTAVWTGSKMIIWGGVGPGGVVLNNGGIYDPATNTWESISVTAAPSARHAHSVVWTGTRMLLWGGAGNAGFTTAAIPGTNNALLGYVLTNTIYYNDGFSYDPATNTWTAISNTGAPSNRAYHAAVWTGSKMIIWGGHDVTTELATGGVYDPANNTWSLVSNAGAPAKRSNWHAGYYFRTGTFAVWTGERMLIYGGTQRAVASTLLYTPIGGGMYDPATNTWTTVNPNGAPRSSANPSLVWTGSHAVVFGGWEFSINAFTVIAFNSGGIFDPKTNTWQATSTVGAPSGRDMQSATWIGDGMFIFGGSERGINDFGFFRANGGIFY